MSFCRNSRHSRFPYAFALHSKVGVGVAMSEDSIGFQYSSQFQEEYVEWKPHNALCLFKANQHTEILTIMLDCTHTRALHLLFLGISLQSFLLCLSLSLNLAGPVKLLHSSTGIPAKHQSPLAANCAG